MIGTPLKHTVNPKLKHTYLVIENDGTLHIKSPGLTNAQLEKLLLKKSEWIKRGLAKQRNKKGNLSNLAAVSHFWLFGKAYPFTIAMDERVKRSSLHFNGTEIKLCAKDEKSAQRTIYNFYKKELIPVIERFIDRYADAYALWPKDVVLRKTKRQWGSCSASNRLSFNTSLAKAPLACIEYVVVHELCHIRHKNHSKAFWQLVEELMPDYKRHRTSLKEFLP